MLYKQLSCLIYIYKYISYICIFIAKGNGMRKDVSHTREHSKKTCICIISRVFAAFLSTSPNTRRQEKGIVRVGIRGNIFLPL